MKQKTYFQAMIFHCIDKRIDFERGYQNLKLSVQG